MSLEIPMEVLSVFIPTENFLQHDLHPSIKIRNTGNGLINQSYNVTCANGTNFFIQQLNTNVFSHTDFIQENYRLLWQYLQNKNICTLMPAPIFPNENTLVSIDKSGNQWRAFKFVPNSYSIPIAANAQQVFTVAKTFARFTATFEKFDASLLKDTITNFHNLAFRYIEFEQALTHADATRKENAVELISALQERAHYKSFYENVTSSTEFPKRVMHHDAKISNVLFSTETNEVICPVDFDTTMSGYFFSDIGDMIRSMTCSLDEASTDFDNIQIIKEYYKAIIEGYTSEMNHLLTESEKKHIHCAGLIMIYMQALRFLTDYLNGDIYYKTTYPEQNFNRALNQLTLLQRLEFFLEEEYNFNQQIA